MNNDAARRHEDEQTRARHEEAVAAGERRLLARTMSGGGIAGLVYAARLALAEGRARRIRRERGLPDPSPRQLD